VLPGAARCEPDSARPGRSIGPAAWSGVLFVSVMHVKCVFGDACAQAALRSVVRRALRSHLCWAGTAGPGLECWRRGSAQLSR
jgi:hypothetical protein